MMRRIIGSPISAGLAAGHAVVVNAQEVPVETYPVDNVDREVVRLTRALKGAKSDLQALQKRLHGEFGSGEAEIFATHYSMLDDPYLIEDIVQRIKRDRINVEAAIAQSVDEFTRRLSELDDPYLREREQDIRDIGQRLLRHAGGYASARLSTLAANSIIVATELMPSDLVELDYRCLSGFVVEHCGATSHIAILARALGIPAVSGIAHLPALVSSGQYLLLDGDSGAVVVEPSFSTIQGFRQQQSQRQAREQAARIGAQLPCQLADGTTISLLANLGRPSEEELLALASLDGVGLLRTEFLFLEHGEPPSEDLQTRVYRDIAARCPGTTVIRTLDLGGDKFPLFLERDLESNPNLGVRGLRFSLTAGESLFRNQVRAILRVAAEHSIAIMFPMVVGVDDVRAAKAMVLEMAEAMELQSLPPVGALIETPAAVLMIDEILDHIDFVGIGSNDLTQFMLAADRNAQTTAEDYSVLHPSVLRAINAVIVAANRKAKPVSICGEAASQPQLAGLFVGMGVRRLSMSPKLGAAVKQRLRQLTLAQLQALAADVLSASSSAQITEVLAAMKVAGQHS